MGFAVKKSRVHPYTTRKKGVCGGRSIIEGTRIPVWSIIKWYKLGMSIEDIMREFPQLSPSLKPQKIGRFLGQAVNSLRETDDPFIPDISAE